MKYSLSSGILILLALVWPLRAGQTPVRPTPEQVEFFEKRIRPVLADNCWSCHGPKKQSGNIRLDSRISMMSGHAPPIIPGQPDRSPLIRAINQQGEIKMPPKGKLPPEVIADLTTWVKMGAPWSEEPSRGVQLEPDAWKKHWAFQPVKNPPLPAVKNAAWCRTPIDRFILAKLEEKGLQPAPPADPRTLLRRLYYDLIGLPPTTEETEAFLKSAIHHPQSAIMEVVERLLASPHYGERWGRHWLDVARYADTKGYVFQEERRYAYSFTYRDYVIRAFNQDTPYDRFILEQLAADRLLAEAPSSTDRRTLAAMGFLTLGRRFLNNIHDIIDDRIDVVSRGLLGLTVACARCHDHKYDPIPSKDYYSLYGVFASSVEPKDLPVLEEPQATPQYQAYRKELEAREQAVKEYQEKHQAELAAGNRKFRDGLRALQKKVDEWRATNPTIEPRAMVLIDAPNPVNPVVFLRGNPGNPGPTVPRQFLGVLSGPERKPFTRGSGRLELARAIASRDNPLTARVMVNRIWLHHFGQGLVATPSDFGLRSDPPSHPELLDWLARYFMDNGWSVKKVHRLIVSSAVYQQTSEMRNATFEVRTSNMLDPENRLLSRMNRRRLDLEQLRDTLLAVAGTLDLTMGGPAVDITTAPFSTRRTVYGFIDRQNLPGLFRTFDFASPDTSTPQRHQTTVPQQALFLMNHPFVQQQVRALMKRPELSGEMAPAERIRRLYRRLYGRTPDADELRLGLAFVSRPEAAPPSGGMNAWERYAQVLLLSNELMFVD